MRHRGDIIYPPINTTRFSSSEQIGDFYLVVSRLVAYKRIDLAVETFNRNGLPLYIVGEGTDKKRLMGMAKGNIRFLGRLADEEVTGLMSQCRALLFPGEEDFGITPLEAMASGAPVIAFGEGGALETVTAETGIFFTPQTIEALMEAILKVEEGKVLFSEERCRTRAREFSKERFQQEFSQAVSSVLK